MRQECINYKYSYGSNYPVGRLINVLGLKMQVCTQRYDRRPYGVGLLVAGYDVSLFCYQIFAHFTILIKLHFRIKDLTSTRHVQAPITTIAKQWQSELALKVLVRTWKSI